MTIARLPTYDISLEMSHKNNKPCRGLIIVLIVRVLLDNMLLVICLVEQYYSLEI